MVKHFLSFLAVVFLAVFGALYWKKQSLNQQATVPVVRVFATASFINQWGPGPWLKQQFESQCGCQVQFVDALDTTSLIQRMKTEPRSLSADLVFGLDQFELELAQKGFEWKTLSYDPAQFAPEVKSWVGKTPFVPYDFGVLAFVGRPSQVSPMPTSFDSLLASKFRHQISLQDPRTSSLGFQLLLWLVSAKGEDGAFQYLKKFNPQVKALSPSWSMAYGLFQKSQVLLTFSYVTSPVYHLVEEKNSDVVAFEFQEGHPLQVEFAGVPSTCRNCELAEKFLALALSPTGQKVLMEKNYMFPVIPSVVADSVFAQVPKYPLLKNQIIPTLGDRERLLRKWTGLRRFEE